MIDFVFFLNIIFCGIFDYFVISVVKILENFDDLCDLSGGDVYSVLRLLCDCLLVEFEEKFSVYLVCFFNLLNVFICV